MHSSIGVPAATTDGWLLHSSRAFLRSPPVDISFGGPLAHQDIIDDTLSVTPYITEGNTVTWRCGNAPGARRYLDGSDLGHSVL